MPTAEPNGEAKESRTGFELELLLPRGLTRVDFARALAQKLGGPVRHGLKYLYQMISAEGRKAQCCELTPAVSWTSPDSKHWVHLVDDFTLRDGLDSTAPPRDNAWRLVTDDPRIAVVAERLCRAESPDSKAVLASFLEVFNADVGALGEGYRCHPTHRLIRDLHGRVLAVLAPYGEERERVCELVTSPLTSSERFEFLADVLTLAQELGAAPASDGGLHVHFDAGPWRNTRRLKALVEGYNARRDALLSQCAPNPRSEIWRGPFPNALEEASKEVPVGAPFEFLAATLQQAGAEKARDLNVLGVIRSRSPQPTLEARMLGVSLDVGIIRQRVDALERFLETF